MMICTFIFIYIVTSETVNQRVINATILLLHMLHMFHVSFAKHPQI